MKTKRLKARPILRYPGSKAKLVKTIRCELPHELGVALLHQREWTYAEPFIGAGAIAGDVLPRLREGTRVILNDKDLWLVCLWNAIKRDPESLCMRISDFTPSAESFYLFKRQDGDDIDPRDAGFRKLALHYTSYSGLGVMAGGPLGGRSGNSEYYPGCRWNAERMKERIWSWHRLFATLSVTITNLDFADVLRRLNEKSYAYLDPPYYEKGGELYKHRMTESDHSRLAGILKSAKYLWALSYDDHPAVRDLYQWASIRTIEVTYTVAKGNKRMPRKNHEILITPNR